MATSFKIKFDAKRVIGLLNKLKDIDDGAISEQRDAQELGDKVVKAMKELVASGVSPISSKKFPSYKNSYRAAIKGGQYSDYNKYTSPVNLNLTGEFLKNLVFRVVRNKWGYIPEVGFYDHDSQQKELGHREGANSQKKRPIIPQDNEKLAKTLINIQLEHYKKLMVRAITRITRGR